MNDSQARILIVDDDHAFSRSTAALLRADGHYVDTVDSGQQGIIALRTTPYDLMILDLRMPGLGGLGVVEALRLWGNLVPVLMISGYGTIDNAVRALHLGADDFLTKPVEPEILSARVSELLERRPQRGGGDASPAGFIGRSEPIREVVVALRKVAPTETTVLVTGETGTGKELVARAVHRLSPRRNASFLVVNCAALADGVLESELFGHVRGAFTGAHRDRVGLFEAAAGGTLFLDEIGEMSVSLQQRLLRVLQEREVVRVGATRATKVDVRIVAATNRDLRALVAADRFREDLLYRLAVFPIHLPPLRDRRSDIPLIAEHALEQIRAQVSGRDGLSCSPFAMRLLRAFEWPGNVRQLFTVLESAAIRADFGRIGAQHLPAELRNQPGAPIDRYRSELPENDERAEILAALKQTGGVLARSAELLGMGRTTLWRKLRMYGLRSGDSGADEMGR